MNNNLYLALFLRCILSIGKPHPNTSYFLSPFQDDLFVNTPLYFSAEALPGSSKVTFKSPSKQIDLTLTYGGQAPNDAIVISRNEGKASSDQILTFLSIHEWYNEFAKNQF